MHKDFGGKTYAFITGYLLGVDRRALEHDFVEDYAFSEGLEKLKKIPNAEKLRSLSRIKQDILRNFNRYKDAKDLETATKGYVDFDLTYLKDIGLDLNNTYRLTLDISDTLNVITENINKIVDDVLTAFNFPYKDKIVNLFYMYNTNKKNLLKLTTTLKGKGEKFPYGIVIIRGSKAMHHLPFVLQNDKNLVISSHTISQEYYDMEKISIPRFDWDTIESSGEAPRLPIDESSTLYVDCDNIDFFVFLSMLDSLNKSTKEGEHHTIKLFLDSMASPIWRLVDKLIEGKFVFEFIEVQRLKDTKSVVDIVISTHITKDSISNPTTLQGIVSSDSDFFGIIEGGIELFVLYDGKYTNTDYIQYLKRNKLMHFDISGLSTSESRVDNRKMILMHLCLYHLTQLPMNKWDATTLRACIDTGYNSAIGYNIELINGELESVVVETLKNLTINTEADKVKLTSQGVSYEVKLVS